MDKTAVVPSHTFGCPLADDSDGSRCTQFSSVSEDYLKGLYSSEY